MSVIGPTPISPGSQHKHHQSKYRPVQFLNCLQEDICDRKKCDHIPKLISIHIKPNITRTTIHSQLTVLNMHSLTSETFQLLKTLMNSGFQRS